MRVRRRPERLAGGLVGGLSGHVRLEVAEARRSRRERRRGRSRCGRARRRRRSSPGTACPPRISPPPTPVPSVSMTMSLVPRPAPARHSAIAAAFPSLSIATGSPSRSRITSRNGTSDERDVHRADRDPGALVDPRRDPEPDRDHVVVEQLAHGGLEPVEERLLGFERASGTRGARAIVPSRPTRPARIFVPPTSTPMTLFNHERRLIVTRRMPSEEKPYRVYRGGRVKGKVPTPKPERSWTARPALPVPAEPALAAVDSGRDRPLPRARPRLGARELFPVPGRRVGGQQAPRPARPAGARRAARRRDGHPPARHRPRAALRAGVGEPQRLDHARPRRHEPAPDRLPLDPARPRGRDPRARRLRRSTRRCSSAARRSPSRR